MVGDRCKPGASEGTAMGPLEGFCRATGKVLLTGGGLVEREHCNIRKTEGLWGGCSLNTTDIGVEQ
jgi:hypothetical protein